MILYIVDGIVWWWHEDISLKEQEEFINDDNCIVIDKVLEIPVKPEDNKKIQVLKYNSEIKELYYDVIGIKEPTQEELIKDTHTQVVTSSEDTLINMELNTDTNTKVTLTGDDSLLLMEMLVTIDEKLTQLLSPKQV